jgi:hypothetical protein
MNVSTSIALFMIVTRRDCYIARHSIPSYDAIARRLGTNLHALVARDYSLVTLAGEGREILRALGETVAAPH